VRLRPRAADDNLRRNIALGGRFDPEEGRQKMRRTLYLAVLLMVGCQGVVGPRQRPPEALQVDNPALPIEEQKRLGRDRLALPEQSPLVAPRAYSDFLGPFGR
jgi:hypothetical protein